MHNFRNLALFSLFLLFSTAVFSRSDYMDEYERLFHRPPATVAAPAPLTEASGETAKITEIDRLVKTNTSFRPSFVVATIDLMLVAMLHPDMRDYNFIADTFSAPLPTNLTVDPKFYMKEMHDRFANKQEELLQRLKKRDQKQYDLNIAMEDRKISYANNMQYLQLRAKEENWLAERLNTELQKMEEELWSDIFKLNKQIETVGQEFEQWREKELVNIFMTGKEREQKFGNISHEIQSVISELMKEKGLVLVLHRSVRTKPQLQVPTAREMHLLGVSGEQNLLSSLASGQIFLGYDNSEASRERLYDALAGHFRLYGRLADFFAPVADNTIFGVSTDITIDVLKTIWLQRGVNPDLITKLELVAKVWFSGGRR